MLRRDGDEDAHLQNSTVYRRLPCYLPKAVFKHAAPAIHLCYKNKTQWKRLEILKTVKVAG